MSGLLRRVCPCGTEVSFHVAVRHQSVGVLGVLFCVSLVLLGYMPGGSDAACDFGGESGASSVSVCEHPAKKARNTDLKICDLAPARVLNPLGKSGVGGVSAADFWFLLGEGNSHTAYFSNLHSSDVCRRRIGLRQVAGALDEVCDAVLTDIALAYVVKESLLKELKIEAAGLKTHVEKLKQRAAEPNLDSTVRRVGCYRVVHGDEELEAAAEELRKWLLMDYSPLRAFVSCVSCGGLFFVAQCHQKCARGFAVAGGGSVAAFKAASTAGGGLAGG